MVKVGDDGSQSVVGHISRELSYLLSHLVWPFWGDISCEVKVNDSDYHFHKEAQDSMLHDSSCTCLWSRPLHDVMFVKIIKCSYYSRVATI